MRESSLHDEFVSAIRGAIDQYNAHYPKKSVLARPEDEVIKSIEAGLSRKKATDISNVVREQTKKLGTDIISIIFGTTSSAYLKRHLLAVINSPRFDKFDLLSDYVDRLEALNHDLKKTVDSDAIREISIATNAALTQLTDQLTRANAELEAARNILSRYRSERDRALEELEVLKDIVRQKEASLSAFEALARDPRFADFVKKSNLHPAQKAKLMTACGSGAKDHDTVAETVKAEVSAPDSSSTSRVGMFFRFS